MSHASTRLLIIGAGGFGREVLAWAEHVEAENAGWTIGGFLDADPHALDGRTVGVPVIGDPASHFVQPGDRFVCAIGEPAAKLQIARALEERGAQFVNLIHPTARIGPHCFLGKGVILCPHANVSAEAILGDFVTLNVNATVGCEALIGDGATLNSFCCITPGSRLQEGVFLGSGASVVNGASVGQYARVGARTVVQERIKPFSTVMGVPAEVMLQSRPAA